MSLSLKLAEERTKGAMDVARIPIQSLIRFSTHLELSEDIADEIVRLMDAESVLNPKWMAFSN